MAARKQGSTGSSKCTDEPLNELEDRVASALWVRIGELLEAKADPREIAAITRAAIKASEAVRKRPPSAISKLAGLRLIRDFKPPPSPLSKIRLKGDLSGNVQSS